MIKLLLSTIVALTLSAGALFADHPRGYSHYNHSHYNYNSHPYHHHYGHEHYNRFNYGLYFGASPYYVAPSYYPYYTAPAPYYPPAPAATLAPT
jgi:hypothetical protein